MYNTSGGHLSTSMEMIAKQELVMRLTLVVLVVAASAQAALLNRNMNLLRSRLGDVLPLDLTLSGQVIQSNGMSLQKVRVPATMQASTDFCLSTFCASPKRCRDMVVGRASCISDCLDTCYALIQRK